MSPTWHHRWSQDLFQLLFSTDMLQMSQKHTELATLNGLLKEVSFLGGIGVV